MKLTSKDYAVYLRESSTALDNGLCARDYLDKGEYMLTCPRADVPADVLDAVRARVSALREIASWQSAQIASCDNCGATARCKSTARAWDDPFVMLCNDCMDIYLHPKNQKENQND